MPDTVPISPHSRYVDVRTLKLISRDSQLETVRIRLYVIFVSKFKKLYRSPDPIQKVVSEFIFRHTKMEYADNDPRKRFNIEELRKSVQEHGIMRTMEIFHLARPRLLEICKLEGIPVSSRGDPQEP